MLLRGSQTMLHRTRGWSSRTNAELCCLDLSHTTFSTTTTPPTATTTTSPNNINKRKKLPPLRRKRPKPVATILKNFIEVRDEFIRETLSGGQTEPIPLSAPSLEEYEKKASLSPWVPAPDSAARRMLDMCQASANDIHIDLGCGDGRINFHAIDHPYAVQQTIGIDIDETLIEKARERLTKRHPQPNAQFHLADLLDSGHDVWRNVIPEATIITMFFVHKALRQIRPFLEDALQGQSCKIVTCGYAMPGWNPSSVDRVLDLTLHMYEWTGSSEDLKLTGIDLVGNDKLFDHELNQARHESLQQASQRSASSHLMDDIVMPLTPMIPHEDLNDDDDSDDDYDDAIEYHRVGEADDVGLKPDWHNPKNIKS